MSDKSINKINEELAEALKLSEYSDKRLVFGEGKLNPRLALIGEAPGGDEEKTGRPFVGKAGKNLEAFLEGVGLNRQDIYITNTVKIRPVKLSPKTGKPVNAAPDMDMIKFFKPYLFEELNFINAKIIATLGNTPLNAVSDEKLTIGDCHGQLIKTKSFTIFPLYHPAAVIYNQSLKNTYLEDINKLAILVMQLTD